MCSMSISRGYTVERTALGFGATRPLPFWHPKQPNEDASAEVLATQCANGFQVISAPRSASNHSSCNALGLAIAGHRNQRDYRVEAAVAGDHSACQH